MKTIARLSLVAMFALAVGCTTSRLPEDKGDIEARILELESRLALRPESPETLRDLGSLHVRANEFAAGARYLKLAFQFNPVDPKTIFFLGLATESLGDLRPALRLYAKHEDVSRRSPYHKLLRGRYEWLSREIARNEVRQLVRQEADLQTVQTSPRRIAVFPLTYLGEDSRYEVLGRGISELVIVDLARVRGVNLVERIRLQALLDELALSASERVDPSTAPRAGRLLGAGRIVGGSFDVLASRDVRLDVSLWDSAAMSSLEHADEVDNLFRLEKELVFDLLSQMGIEPTPEEVDRIQLIPTRNLQAFLAFSRGLEMEDRGDIAGAAKQYRQAVSQDPGFSAAAERSAAVDGMNTSGTTPTTTLHEVNRMERVTTPQQDLSVLRLQNLSTSLGMSFQVGIESRKPATEVPWMGTDLPSPPDPPERQ